MSLEVIYVEYLESTGTQYIDTGFIPNQDTGIDIVTMPLDVRDAGSWQGFIPYGSAVSYYSRAFECYSVGGNFEINYGCEPEYLNLGSIVAGQIVTITPSELMCFDEQIDSSKVSEEVKVIEVVQSLFGKDAIQLLQFFNNLNEEGRQKALESICDLADHPKYTNNIGQPFDC